MKITAAKTRRLAVPRREGGFTLIELLVVITIIAILAGMAFPAYQIVVRKSRVSASMANLKQIGVAIPLYAAENDSKFPPSEDTTGQTYATYLEPYTYDSNSWRLTKENIYFSPVVRKIPTPLNGTGHPISYSMNPLLCPVTTDTSGGSGPPVPAPNSQVRLLSAKRPSETILAVDGSLILGSNWASGGLDAYPSINTTSVDDMQFPLTGDAYGAAGTIRYPDGFATALMVDGSVKRFRKGDIVNANIAIGRRP